MTHLDAILNHIKADAPCSYNHVTGWAISQGFGGSKMIDAIHTMLRRGNIDIDTLEDGSTVIEFIKD